jgi:hypothetical protein
MNDNERFLKLMRNVMLSDHYSVLVDGIASRVYEHTPSGTMNISIGEPVCEDLALSGLYGFCWANDYVGAYDKNGTWHDFEFMKYVKLQELLG